MPRTAATSSVIIPAENENDLEEIPAGAALNFIKVRRMDGFRRRPVEPIGSGYQPHRGERNDGTARTTTGSSDGARDARNYGFSWPARRDRLPPPTDVCIPQVDRSPMHRSFAPSSLALLSSHSSRAVEIHPPDQPRRDTALPGATWSQAGNVTGTGGPGL